MQRICCLKSVLMSVYCKVLCICYPCSGHALSGTVGVQDGGDGVQPC